VLFIDNQIPQDPDLYTVTAANFAVSNVNNLVGFVNGQFGFGAGQANIVPRYNRGPSVGTVGSTAVKRPHGHHRSVAPRPDAESGLRRCRSRDDGVLRRHVDQRDRADHHGGGQRILTPSGTASNGLAATTNNTTNNLAVLLTDALGNSRADLIGGTTSPLVLVPVGTTVNAATAIASLGTPLTGRLTFGVDLQRPIIESSGGAGDNALSTGAPITYTFASRDDESAAASALVVPRRGDPHGPRRRQQRQRAGHLAARPDPRTAQHLVRGVDQRRRRGDLRDRPERLGLRADQLRLRGQRRSDHADDNGQYRVRIFVRDQAGNASDTLSRSAVIDNTNPAVGGVSIPQTINGNQPATFTTSATDNLELARAYGQVAYGVAPIAGYGAGTFEFAFPESATNLGTAFDRVFTASAPAINITIAQFVRSVLFTNQGTGIVPATTGTLASSLVAVAEDLVARQGANRAFIPAANINQAGGLTTFNNNGTTPNSINTFVFDVTDANQGGNFSTASTITLGNAGNTPTSLTFRIRQSGGLNVFTSPFQRIELFASQLGGPAVYQRIGTLPNGFVTDDPAATARTITAQLPGFTFPARFTNSVLATGTTIQYNVIAVGISSSGDAVVSQPVIVTILR
jgi:hypothetical protein